jgi:putative phosphoribosyl transferase
MDLYISPERIERDVVMAGGQIALHGRLVVPAGASSLVLFAHGSGSSRFSPRNQYVAEVLQKRGIGTLLLDLLSQGEAADPALVFDIDLLADRLLHAKKWVEGQPETRSLRLGYFGASTGAGAALVAAAKEPENIFALVSRGGRPDLAAHYLDLVTAPVLLIVGGEDEVVLNLNHRALDALPGTKKLEIVPEATHLFEEPGALERVAELAADWFVRMRQVELAQRKHESVA